MAHTDVVAWSVPDWHLGANAPEVSGDAEWKMSSIGPAHAMRDQDVSAEDKVGFNRALQISHAGRKRDMTEKLVLRCPASMSDVLGSCEAAQPPSVHDVTTELHAASN